MAAGEMAEVLEFLRHGKDVAETECQLAKQELARLRQDLATARRAAEHARAQACNLKKFTFCLAC